MSLATCFPLKLSLTHLDLSGNPGLGRGLTELGLASGGGHVAGSGAAGGGAAGRAPGLGGAGVGVADRASGPAGSGGGVGLDVALWRWALLGCRSLRVLNLQGIGARVLGRVSMELAALLALPLSHCPQPWAVLYDQSHT